MSELERREVDGSRLEGALLAIVGALGTWALFAQACVLVGAGFRTLRALSFVPLLAAPLVVRWCAGASATEPLAAAARAREGRALPTAARLGAPAIAVAAYAGTGSTWIFWVLAVVFATVEMLAAPPASSAEARPSDAPTTPPGPRGRAGVVIVIGILGTLAALLTAGARRPDPDDAYFVSAATSALEAPDAALLRFDGMHRDGLPPVEQALHWAGVYELLLAVIASVSGAPVGFLYYVLFPPLWALLALLSHWVALRLLLPRSAALPGLVALVFLLVVWGDGHRTLGNFAFVRLFQGKAAFLLVILPAIVVAAVRFRESPTRRRWLALLLGQSAAAGVTANALLVAPLAAALAVVARPRATRAFAWTLAAGAAASAPLVLLAGATFLRLAPYRGALDVDRVLLGYEPVLGEERAPLALLALLLLPPLAARAGLPRAGWIAGYVWVVVLVVFFPPTASLAASAIGNVFSWRIFWAVPLPLLVSAAAGLVASPLLPRRGLRAFALGIWAAAFALAGPWAVSRAVWSWSNLGAPKVAPAPYAAAELVARVAARGGRALVPEAVAVPLAGLPGAPPLVAVRRLYLAKLDGVIPPDDLALRASLLAAVEGHPGAPPLSRFLKLVERERIATIAFPARHRDARELEAALAARGFSLHRAAGFVVAARTLVDQPARTDHEGPLPACELRHRDAPWLRIASPFARGFAPASGSSARS